MSSHPSISSQPYKRAKPSSSPSSTRAIGTHSGTFQADEALGVWLLRQLPAYRDSIVIRSRDVKYLEERCDIIIDVGGVYDHDKLRYDHHQGDYDERFHPGKRGCVDIDGIGGGGGVTMTTTTTTRCTKLSASGLVYRHYGRDVIRAHYPQLTYGSTELDWVYVRMYDEFMEAIDAIDTGVEPVPPPPAGGSIGIVGPLYRDVTGLSSRVSRLNPRWNEVEETARDAHAVVDVDVDDIDDIDGTVVVRAAPPDPNARFEIACRMCGDDFLDVLTKVVEGDLPARSIVEDAVRGRTDVDASGEIVRLSSWGLPWKSELYELEYELGITVPIKYVLYEDQVGMWRVQCVSVRGKSFENRLGLPEEWRGVRDEDLSKMAGIDGCTFCHASGFIGGNVSYEGALEMARASLRAAGKVKVEF